MIDNWLKAQFDAVVRKMENWPEWEKKEIKAEIERTPLRDRETDREPSPINNTDR